MNKLISVIIPSFNHANYIQDTINSIINQTYPNIELLIVDDGSTDSTLEKLKELEKKCLSRFTRFVIKTKKNSGVVDTLNELISLSQGDYIAICASDDIYTPNALMLEYKDLEKDSSIALVVGNNKIIDKYGKECYWDNSRNNVYNKNEAVFLSFTDFISKVADIDFSSPEFGTYERLYLENHIPNGYLIRKSIFNIIGNYTNLAPLEDYWLMLQISKYAKIKAINEDTFFYRWHGNNTITQTEKMVQYNKKTRDFENLLLINIHSDKCLINYLEFRKNRLLSLFSNEILNKSKIATLEFQIKELKKTIWYKIGKIFYRNLRRI